MTDLAPDMKTAAVAVVVAPENVEQAIAEVPPDRLASLVYWLDRIIERAHAARKCALIEAQVAIDRSELLDQTLSVNGHRYVLRSDSRVVWTDLGRTLGILERDYGLPGPELRAALTDARVSDLRELAKRVIDPERRSDALDLIEGARTRKAGPLSLVDLDDPYRKGKGTWSSRPSRTTPVAIRKDAALGTEKEGTHAEA